ncbi:hypothetical protein J2S17_003646 [Cytobacillus purgationiresistens]|uniref:Uncharacterized protein n=1 Tax=Cytobacillus purgationiresistens TaxID=863449 RepID=A0ABU0AMZ5_9BACI|nr:hypothetical protein [Cytobacillus purgationiresistens]
MQYLNCRVIICWCIPNIYLGNGSYCPCFCDFAWGFCKRLFLPCLLLFGWGVVRCRRSQGCFRILCCFSQVVVDFLSRGLAFRGASGEPPRPWSLAPFCSNQLFFNGFVLSKPTRKTRGALLILRHFIRRASRKGVLYLSGRLS